MEVIQAPAEAERQSPELKFTGGNGANAVNREPGKERDP